MADVDNFDIDIYGDEAGPDEYNGENGGNNYNYEAEAPTNGQGSYDNEARDSFASAKSGNDTSNQNKMDVTPTPPEQSQPTQGVKRKTMDERPIDPHSTNAVQITELHWWFTEDDLRGWCDQAGCEDEVKEITFNEHKVNGKSKGQVYVEFYSQAGATALKHRIDSLEAPKADPKRAIATFFLGQQNPYKTLPKDNNRRNDVRGPGGDRNFSASGQNFSGNNNFSGNFRGRGGQFNSPNRGGMNNGWNRGGGFSGPMNPMGNMGNPMGNVPYGGGMNNNFNNFNRGGGMMNGGMRGGMGPNRGRGGSMSPGPNMMNPMGNMNMGMGMGGMGMNPGMMNMGGGFPNQPQFQQPFFQGQPAGGDWGNPHGAKRHRPNE